MKHDEWLSRWREDRIVFHRDEVNPLLVRFADRFLPGGKPARVLVPLCGKSLDMAWLAERGHEVVGVELAEQALAAFYAENGLPVETVDEPPFRVYRGGGVTAYAGDFFVAGPERLGAFAAAYDRAALIAVPADRRPAYAEHVLSLMAPAARLLLITLDYDTTEMDGPPFAVPPSEVETLFAGAAGVARLLDENALIGGGPLSGAGLSRLTRSAYLVTR